MGLIPTQLTVYRVKDKSSVWEVLREWWWGQGHSAPESSSDWDNALWAAEERRWAGMSSKPLPLFMPGLASVTIIWASGPGQMGKHRLGKDGQERPRWRWGMAFRVKGHLWKHRWGHPHGALRGALSLVQLNNTGCVQGQVGNNPRETIKARNWGFLGLDAKSRNVNLILKGIQVKVLVAQSCPTLWDSMDCNPPGSSVRGIVQARILEWVAIPFSRGSSWPGIKSRSSALQDSLPTEPPGKGMGNDQRICNSDAIRSGFQNAPSYLRGRWGQRSQAGSWQEHQNRRGTLGIRKIPWRRDRLPTPVFLGFSGGSDGIESACNAGDPSSNPGLGRSPGGGYGSSLQYSCLESPMQRGAWGDYSLWGHRVGHDEVTKNTQWNCGVGEDSWESLGLQGDPTSQS